MTRRLPPATSLLDFVQMCGGNPIDLLRARNKIGIYKNCSQGEVCLLSDHDLSFIKPRHRWGAL